MKGGLVFDIETRNLFSNTLTRPEDLDISIVGTYTYNDDSYRTFTVEELPALWDLFKDVTTIIGFNNNHFDTPLLNKYAPFDLGEYKSIDLLETVRGALGRRLRLDWIAEGTLGVKKSGVGTQAVDWWNAGEIDKIRKYCVDDVKITRQLFDHALANKSFAYIDLGVKREFEIDTSSWEGDEENEVVVGSLF